MLGASLRKTEFDVANPSTFKSPARSPGLGFNPQNKQDRFSKSFSKIPEKQPIGSSKLPVVTCFYCMKRGHSVRFCKIRKYDVPRGFMKWIPKCSKGSIDECKPNGPIFIRGPNLCT